eukprot:2638510-Rhodomonas_salina.1
MSSRPSAPCTVARMSPDDLEWQRPGLFADAPFNGIYDHKARFCMRKHAIAKALLALHTQNSIDMQCETLTEKCHQKGIRINDTQFITSFAVQKTNMTLFCHLLNSTIPCNRTPRSQTPNENVMQFFRSNNIRKSWDARTQKLHFTAYQTTAKTHKLSKIAPKLTTKSQTLRNA